MRVKPSPRTVVAWALNRPDAEERFGWEIRVAAELEARGESHAPSNAFLGTARKELGSWQRVLEVLEGDIHGRPTCQ